MELRRCWVWTAIVVVTSGCSALGDDVGGARASLTGEAAARAAVTFAAASLHEEFVREFRDTRRTVRVLTFVGPLGQKQTVGVDEADGTIVDLTVANASEEAALFARCGRLGRALCDHVARGASGSVPIVVWLVHPEPDLNRGLMALGRAAWDAEVGRANASARSLTDREGSRLDAALGTHMYRSRIAPVLAARLSAAQIARVERDPAVGRIMLGTQAPVSDLAGSLSLSKWSSSSYYDGTGVRVGILELGRPPTGWFSSITIRDPSEPPDLHASLVAGIVANTGLAGYANDADLYIANRLATDVDVEDIDWAFNAGALVNNQSWHDGPEETSTDLSARDRYLDWATRERAVFYATAAGNYDEPDFVVHKAYNIVTVGGVYNNGSIINDNPPMSECGLVGEERDIISTWRNGVPQELPHIVADGGCVSAVGTTYAGTSFAAPVIAGMAAGLVEYNPSVWWPETLKAILLASPATQGPWSPDSCDWGFSLDEATGLCTVSDGRDGTGLVNGYHARHMALSRQYGTMPPAGWAHDFGYITTGSFYSTIPHLLNVSHTANGTPYLSCLGQSERLRVVLVWDSNAQCTTGSSGSCDDDLEMDLDLLVYEEPGHTLVAQSATTVNSYEHVDVEIWGSQASCVPFPGEDWSYSIEVRLSNWTELLSSTSTYYAVAWHRY